MTAFLRAHLQGEILYDIDHTKCTVIKNNLFDYYALNRTTRSQKPNRLIDGQNIKNKYRRIFTNTRLFFVFFMSYVISLNIQ